MVGFPFSGNPLYFCCKNWSKSNSLSDHAGRSDAKVGLEMVDRGTPIASLRGSDNLICFYTRRYGANPLVIQGAGAGGEVTAMGVTGDLIKAMERLR